MARRRALGSVGVGWRSAIQIFEKRRVDFAAITTFGFDPVFFERQLLHTKALERASRILVLMDYGEFVKLLKRGDPARHLNSRYLVVPVSPPGGVFHAKLILLVCADGITLACNSANVTRTGYSHNLELLNIGNSTTDQPDVEVLMIASRIRDFLARVVELPGTGTPGAIAADWLRSLMPMDNFEADIQPQAELWTTLDGPLWTRLEALWAGSQPEEIIVISPFYDDDHELLRRVVQLSPDTSVKFVAQNGTSRLDSLAASSICPNLELYDLQVDARRRLHAKLVIWRCQGRWSSLIGSANWTAAAFDGRNIEAMLHLPECSTWKQRLFDEDITPVVIAPEDFKPGEFEAPEKEETAPEHGLRLRSVALSGRQFTLEVQWPPNKSLQTAALDVWVGHDVDPRASIPLSGVGNTTLTAAAPSSLEVGTGLRAALRAETESGILVTQRVWVLRREHLEREIGEGGASSRQRRIRETGEGLEEYLDELATTSGPSTAAEYLRSVMLRYDSGEGRAAGGGGVFRVKVHDPFRGGGVPAWWLKLGSESGDFREALTDFIERHQKQRLLRHAKAGNINGLENFLDILSCLVRLTYRYHCRDERIVPRGKLIGRFCDFAEIATTGIEKKGRQGPGFLETLSTNLRGHPARLGERCREADFSAIVRATLWIAQVARAKNETTQVVPHAMLRSWVDRVERSLAAAGLGVMNNEDVPRGLVKLGFSEEERENLSQCAPIPTG